MQSSRPLLRCCRKRRAPCCGIRALQHRALLVEYARDPSKAERDELLLQRPLQVLERSLKGERYLAGDTFTVTDLNVTPSVAYAKRAELDFSAFPEVARWLEACTSRPAYLRIREMYFKP